MYDLSPSTALSRARKLIQTYISETGLYQVNLPSRTVDQITKELAKIENDVEGSKEMLRDGRLFDEARSEIAGLLERDSVMRFLEVSKRLENRKTVALASSGPAVVAALDAEFHSHV